MVGTTGKVIGVEHIPELVDLSKRNVAKDQPDYQESGRVRFVGKALSLLSERKNSSRCHCLHAMQKTVNPLL